MSGPTPARRVAYEVLRRVFEHGAYADRALRSATERVDLDARERALAQRLAYGSVQRRGTTDHVIATLCDRPVELIEAPLLAALRLGLFELLFDDAAAPYATVDQAVELAKGGRDGGRRHKGAGLVNAVLRRAARERTEILAGFDHETAASAALEFSVPEWIVELWWRERGPERAVGLLRAANEPPRRHYRVAGAGSGPELAGRLSDAGVDYERVNGGLPAGLELLAIDSGGWVAVEDLVRAGSLVPQSLGSALAAGLLEVQPGERVLDLCAAPGIKTTQLAAGAGADGEVVAVERDPPRAAELRRLCERVGAGNVEVLVGDGTELELGSGYDRVLVDAPCSGLGTLASRPDLRWRQAAEGIAPLAELQSRLLAAGTTALRPGGRAIYSVCTISRAEGEAVVSEELGRDPRLHQVDLGAERPELADDRQPRSLQLLGDRDRTDGFFIAALERAA